MVFHESAAVCGGRPISVVRADIDRNRSHIRELIRRSAFQLDDATPGWNGRAETGAGDLECSHCRGRGELECPANFRFSVDIDALQRSRGTVEDVAPVGTAVRSAGLC